MQHILPIFQRRCDTVHEFDFTLHNLEDVPQLIGPGISFLQRIGDFTAAEKNFLFADISVPLKAAGHPYFVF
jgi:hypothetical protein